MNRFSPVTHYLRSRLGRTCYEDIEEYKALMILERLILQPLRGWFEETLFLGLRERFPQETRALIFEVRFGCLFPDPETATALRRSLNRGLTVQTPSTARPIEPNRRRGCQTAGLS